MILDMCWGVGLLDYMVVLILNFWGTSTLFSKVTIPIYILTNKAQVFPFSTVWPIFTAHYLFPFPRSARWFLIVVLILYFLSDYWCWAYFHVSFDHLYVYFGKISIQVLYLFLTWIYYFVLFCIYYWWYTFRWLINLLSGIYGLHIFSYSKISFSFC